MTGAVAVRCGQRVPLSVGDARDSAGSTGGECIRIGQEHLKKHRNIFLWDAYILAGMLPARNQPAG